MSDTLPSADDRRPAPNALASVLGPLASLKLTVVLFAMSIVIVLAGTLAQVNADVWDVVDEYFRVQQSQLSGSVSNVAKAFFVRVPLRIFAPDAFFPSRPADQFRAAVPADWKSVPPDHGEKARFELPGSTESAPAYARVWISKESLRDRAGHWGAEAGLLPDQALRLLSKPGELKVGESEAEAFEFKGTKLSVLSAVIPAQRSSWFFDVSGPNEVIDREAKKFNEFVSSATFPQWPSVIFPKGWVIGGLMLLNLLSAHLIRFRIQARGARLVAGIWLLAMGVLVTWLVVASGNNNDGLQTMSLISYRKLWDVLLFGMLALAAGSFWLGLKTGVEHKVERRMAFGAAAALAGTFAWLFLAGIELWKSDASMRILYQLVKGTIAGLVLLAGCQALFKKRAGIVLLHGGVALLMISEVLVGLKAVETKMLLGEGETGQYLFDTRHPELAIIDTSNPDEDTHTVIPLVKLQTTGKNVEDEENLLPFNVESVRVYKNSMVPPALPPDKDNLGTAGIGLKRQLHEMPASTGVSNEAGVDLPGLYVKLTDKKSGADLGTWLTHVFEEPQQVTVDGKTYELQLRFGREYLPYTVKLIDVEKDDYLGTRKTRNYSSDVIIRDSDKKADQPVRIWMNNPLRYRGLTFYQSGYQRDERSGREFTTLQVVSNQGWMIPYVSCMIVGVGMAYQFVLTLLRFLNRSIRLPSRAVPGAPEVIPSKDSPAQAAAAPGIARWLVPLIITLLAAGYVGSKARPMTSRPSEMDIAAFAKLPLAYEGRVKPFDTLARNSLLILSGKQEYRDANGKKQPAIRWLLDVISSKPEARDARVFRITNHDVLQLLKLDHEIKPEEQGTRDNFMYSVNDFAGQIQPLVEALSAIDDLPKESYTLYQRSLSEMGHKVQLYRTLMMAFDPPIPDLPSEEEQKADREGAGRKFMRSMLAAMEESKRIEEAQVPLSIPVPEAESSAGTKTTGQWQPFSSAAVRAFLGAQLGRDPVSGREFEIPKQTVLMQKMLVAWRQNDVSAFNDSVHEYTRWLKSNNFQQLDLGKVRFETFFNQFAPFYWSMVLCLFVFILSIVSWLGFTEPLRRSAFWLMALTFVIHTFALVARIYISGRPPVTNLYSTGIFIGWAVVLLGLFCEWFYRLGVGNAVASIAGFITLGISHFLAEGGDTFTVLEAVLDTQFWLATHVVTINLGYAATAAAGLFGVYYILSSLVPATPPEVGKAVTRMTYGSLCFAILFSFIGTVLGGLWADDSWGRFWGWDPKENGALIIVLWNCLVLHAKWDGMIKDRGLAILSTLGLIAVSWSWFGTNQLGAGLHAYGFTNAARIGLFVTWAVSLVIAGIGCMSRRSEA